MANAKKPVLKKFRFKITETFERVVETTAPTLAVAKNQILNLHATGDERVQFTIDDFKNFTIDEIREYEKE